MTPFTPRPPIRPLTVLLAIGMLTAAPAAAYLDSVDMPPVVIAGKPFPVSAFGNLPDTCWELVDHTVTSGGNVITYDVFIADTAPPGAICLTVLVPYEATAQVTVPTAGQWLLRVVEHPGDWPPWETIEVEFTADEAVVIQGINWGSLRARYR